MKKNRKPTRRVMKVKDSLLVTIPDYIVESHKIEKGDDLSFTTSGKKIIMEKQN